MEMMPRRERLDNDDEVSGLYNKTTCVEFHQLLVSTLLSFGKALEGYAAAKSFEDLLQSAKEVNRSGTLLWYIGYSHILENHLKVLHTKKLLNLPVNTPQHLETFFTFTGFVRTPKTQVILRLTNEVDGGADDTGNSDEGGGEGVDDSGNEAGTTEDQCYEYDSEPCTWPSYVTRHMIESHGEHDQRPAHDPMWPGYTSIKELPHPFRRSRTPVHQHGLMPLDPHQSEALCASLYLPYQRIGIAPGIRRTLSQYHRDTPGYPRVLPRRLMTLGQCTKKYC
jgi:hypothetical protein